MDDNTFEQIRKAFYDYGIMFFREQTLTPEQKITFAGRWSSINVNRFFKQVDGYPKIAEVRKDPDQGKNIGGSWHTDHSYDQIPAMASILYARKVPDVGGDTIFSSMYAAYTGLSEGIQKLLLTLTAHHSSRHAFGKPRGDDRIGNPYEATQDARHPLVIRHPETRQGALYVNRAFTAGIEGWHDAESKALLEFLYEHAQRPEFTCRFKWGVGSLAMWDNRVTWHRALNDYAGQRRYMHRITLEGASLPAGRDIA